MSFATQTIQPANFLSVAAINRFNAEVKTIIESDVAIVLVDLSNITSMSSSSFIAVVKTLQLVRASNRQLFLCSMNEQIRMMFELTGLDQVFKAFSDFDEFSRYIQTHGVVGVPRHAKPGLEVMQRNSLKLAS